MDFKLDENFGTRTQHLFRAAGHRVSTIRDEALQGRPDRHTYDACCAERVCLVTMDLDSANAGQFPPDRCGGIVVIRVPRNPSLPLLEQLISQFLTALIQASVEKQLWIVEVGRIRIRQREN